MDFISYVLKSYERKSGSETPRGLGDLYETINKVKLSRVVKMLKSSQIIKLIFRYSTFSAPGYQKMWWWTPTCPK